MTYYDDYEEDARYAREIYWESKGLGYSTPEKPKPANETRYLCIKCGRYGTRVALELHWEKYPNCDK